MKNILIPTDFSPCAKVAENIGLEIAKLAQAEIHFLHIVSTPIEWIKLPLEREELYPETKAEIAKAKSELNSLVSRATKLGLKSSQFLVFDKNREEIERHIKHHHHDFVVMGTHGTKGFKELIGSNTQKVIRASTVPTLIVKENQNDFSVKNIVFASNFESDAINPFLEVSKFAELLKAQIHLLYVNMPFSFIETDEAHAKMSSFLSKCGGNSCSLNIYNALNEERGIEKFSESIKADIIALTTHGKTGFSKLLSPSICESLANHTNTPVLSINTKK